jgi:DNA repair exonuclease SbcCD ATPase subunit
MGYRLETIDLAGFRGFNARQQISLNNVLVIFYAPNGYGKSSLCEAIEWAIYGNTARRLRGERNINRREFENSLRNRFFPKNEEAYVALILNDGKKNIEIRRVITADEGPGVLFLNGHRIDSLANIGVSKDIRHALILQHAIRDFIFSKPGDRLDLVSAQLGIGSLTNFQTCLQNASRSFKTKPANVSAALDLRQQVMETCSTSPAMGILLTQLEHHDVERATLESTASSIFKELCGCDLPQGQAGIAAIDSEIDKVVNRAFDFSKLDIDRDVEQEYERIFESISSIISSIAEHHSILRSALLLQDLKHEREMIELAKLGFLRFSD